MDDDLLLDLATGPDGAIFAAGPDGLRRSADQGQSWLICFQANSVPAAAVAIAGDGAVFAAVPGGIGRSRDGGETWSFVRLPPPAPLISSLAIAPSGAVVAGTMQDGLLFSEDGGTSWHARNAGLFDPDVRGVAVSRTFESDETVFAATSTGLFQSTNGGRRWRAWGDLPELEPISCLRIVANDELFAAIEGAGLWMSAHDHSRWRRIGLVALPENIEIIVTDPVSGMIVVSGEDTAHRSTDGGETWRTIGGVVAGLTLS